MKICVTEDDIKKGEIGLSASCPIARSLKRRGFKGVMVVPFFIRWSDGVVRTPKECKRFMNRFDSDLPVKPFSFNIVLEKP